MSNKKAKELLERALKVTPRATQTMSKGYQMWCLDDNFPIFAESGDGCMMRSVDGVDFIDIMGALGPNILGYCDKKVNAAVKKQIDKGMIFSLPCALETDLGEAISSTCALSNSFLNSVIAFCVSFSPLARITFMTFFNPSRQISGVLDLTASRPVTFNLGSFILTPSSSRTDMKYLFFAM